MYRSCQRIVLICGSLIGQSASSVTKYKRSELTGTIGWQSFISVWQCWLRTCVAVADAVCSLTMSSDCVPVSALLLCCPPAYSLQHHDWFTAFLTFGLCCGLIVSYLPQVIVFVVTSVHQLDSSLSTCVSLTKALQKDLVLGFFFSAAPRLLLAF